jgi:hypothetical protein
MAVNDVLSFIFNPKKGAKILKKIKKHIDTTLTSLEVVEDVKQGNISKKTFNKIAKVINQK